MNHPPETATSKSFGLSGLPIHRDIKTPLSLSMVIAVLMGVMSLVGLIFPGRIYPSEAMRQTYMTNDLINILIGLPYLLVSIYLTRRGKLIGLLLWPGALLYVLYNYAAYVMGMPFGWTLIANWIIVLLSAYVFFEILRQIDKAAVKTQLEGLVPRKTASWFLLVFGVIFIFRAVSMIAQAFIDQIPLPLTELGVLIADIILSTCWVIGGVLLLRQKPFGYVSGLGLLFAAGLLFVGLILFLLVQPILTSVPFAPVDVLVVFIMGLVCFIPCALYMRGVLKAG